MAKVTNAEWLDEVLNSLVNEVEWCVNPAAGAISVNREKEQTAQAQAKATILTHIDTVCREARGCVDCKTLRCENCERLWTS